MNRLTTEQFIEKAKLIHGDKYDYSSCIYKNKRTQQNDKIKNDFVIKEGIKLIRIPYTKFNNIEKILNKKI